MDSFMYFMKYLIGEILISGGYMIFMLDLNSMKSLKPILKKLF